MRRNRVLRSTSAQSVCLFCACRLTGNVPPVATAVPGQRRLLHRSDRLNQQATAPAPSASDADAPQWTFDANSSLSPAEQREKAHRQQAREQQEAARQIEAFQLREALRQRDKERREGLAAQRKEQSVKKHEENERPKARQRSGGIFKLDLRRDEEPQARNSNITDVTSARQQGNYRRNQPQAEHSEQQKRGTEQHKFATKRRVDVSRREEESRAENTNIRNASPFGFHIKSRPIRDQMTRQPQPEPKVKRTSMPSFASASAAEPEAPVGWGRGSTETKPLQYKSDEQIAAETAEVEAEARSVRNFDERGRGTGYAQSEREVYGDDYPREDRSAVYASPERPVHRQSERALHNDDYAGEDRSAAYAQPERPVQRQPEHDDEFLREDRSEVYAQPEPPVQSQFERAVHEDEYPREDRSAVYAQPEQPVQRRPEPAVDATAQQAVYDDAHREDSREGRSPVYAQPERPVQEQPERAVQNDSQAILDSNSDSQQPDDTADPWLFPGMEDDTLKRAQPSQTFASPSSSAPPYEAPPSQRVEPVSRPSQERSYNMSGPTDRSSMHASPRSDETQYGAAPFRAPERQSTRDSAAFYNQQQKADPNPRSFQERSYNMAGSTDRPSMYTSPSPDEPRYRQTSHRSSEYESARDSDDFYRQQQNRVAPAPRSYEERSYNPAGHPDRSSMYASHAPNEPPYRATPGRSSEYQTARDSDDYYSPQREYAPTGPRPLQERGYNTARTADRSSMYASPSSDEFQYRATPFRPSEYQTANDWEDGQAKTWEHLRPRNSAPPPPPSSPPQTTAANRRQREHFPIDDEAMIDRQFREHKRQRDEQSPLKMRNPLAPQYQPSPDDALVPNPNMRENVAPEFTGPPGRRLFRCARCLEPGHSARECTGPIRSKCHNCGESGHTARFCPRRRNDVQRDFDATAGRSQIFDRDTGDRTFRKTSSQEAGWNTENRGRDERERGRQQYHGPGAESAVENPGYYQPVLSRQTWDTQPAARQEERPAVAAWGLGQANEEPEDDAAERRARRSRRGFVEDAAEEAPAPKQYGRRKEAHPKRREVEEDADDEALAAREERAARKAARKAQEKADAEKKRADRAAGQREGGGTPVHLPEFVSVANLAQQLDVGYEPFVQRLEELGYDDVFPGKVLNRETSGMIAMEYDFEPVYETPVAEGGKTEEEERDLKPAPEIEDTTFLPVRPPVVTIMGHVDHGKTTILDYLRRTSVAAGEAGGITQHIGAFSVPLSESGKTITFLDTPGHAAFMSMRQRGANVTDMVILVVAADDSVKPQTLESIRCAREAGVPMIVAVNKVDKEEADVQRVKQDLSRHGVEIEDFGGEVQVVEVSGKTGHGMEELEENVVTLSEILDHRSDTEGAVEGWVLEATTKRAGRVATVLVKRGTLRPGAVLVAGNTWARVRSLRDERDQIISEVGPGMPIEVDGWRDQPVAGDQVLQAPGEQKATDVVDFRVEKGDRVKMQDDMEAINENRRAEQERRRAAERAEKAAAAAALAGENPDATAANPGPARESAQEESTGQLTQPFIIKADVSGSAEAVSAYIPSLTSPLIAPTILASSVGPINESDVELASAAAAHIIAFSLPKNEEMRGLAESKGVQVLENNIIYRVLEDVKVVLEARLPAVVTQRVVGEAEVGMVFEIGVGGRKKVRVAGCKVRNGVVGRNARVRVLRGGEKIYDGVVDSLKNHKKDAKEMGKGTDCGMGFDGWEGFEQGDLVQTYEEVSEKRRL